MNLYLISQSENNDYDTYSDAVVAAKTEDEAKRIHPSSFETDKEWWKNKEYPNRSWATKLENVRVDRIGIAVKGTKPGVICASFHAG